MRRSTRLLLAVVTLQVALLGVYWLVEYLHVARKEAQTASLSTESPRRVDVAMPSLVVRDRGGRRVNLRDLARPTLVHFWATWCPPCRVELPGLIALADKYPIDVMAVALDEDWPDVERFLDRRSSPNIVLGDVQETNRALGVQALPVTFLVQPGGRISLRFDGARDWADPDFLRTWLEAD